MAIYEVKAPDGSIILVRGPDGASQEEVTAEAQRLFAERGATTQPPTTAAAPATEQPGLGSEMLRQLGLTVRGGARGAAGLAGIFTDPVAAIINQALPEDRRLRTLSSAVELILNDLGVPQPRNALERVVNEAVAGVSAAGGTVGAARQASQALTSPVSRTVSGMLAAQPGGQLVSGAAGGGAGQTAAEMGAGAAGQAIAGLAGGVAGGAGTSVLTRPGSTADVEMARRVGVPLMTSDVMPPQTGISRGIQRVGEAIPLAGTTRPRLAQEQARGTAVRDLLNEYNASGANVSDQLVADLASKRSSQLNEYVNLKGSIFMKLDARGEMPLPRTLAAIDEQIENLRTLQAEGHGPQIARLEDRLRSLRSSSIVLPGDMKKGMIADIQKELRDLRAEDKKGRIYEPAIKILENWRAALPGKTVSEVEELRKNLGEQFTAPELTAMRTTGEKAVSSIYKQLREDMGEFIKTNGDRRDFTKWKVANRRLENLGSELDMTAFKSTLNRGEATPEIVENMLFSKRPSEIRQLYKSLTPQGRSVAQAAILSRAARDSEVMVGAEAQINPTKFADQVRELGDSVGVFFKGDDLKRVQGLVRVLNLSKRAEEVAARASQEPSAAQVAGSLASFAGLTSIPLAGLYSLFGGGILGAGAAGVGAGTIGLATRFYESRPVRNLLIRINDTSPGSREELELATKLATLKVPQQDEE